MFRPRINVLEGNMNWPTNAPFQTKSGAFRYCENPALQPENTGVFGHSKLSMIKSYTHVSLENLRTAQALAVG